MAFQCPTCGSRRVRQSHTRSWQESILKWLGWYAARCRDCDTRFLGHFLMPDSWIYAKCPKCYRTDLSTWDDRHIRARATTRVKLWLGAERMRCEACRCNFASFRTRKSWYRRGKPQDFDSSEAALPQKENGSK